LLLFSLIVLIFRFFSKFSRLQQQPFNETTNELPHGGHEKDKLLKIVVEHCGAGTSPSSLPEPAELEKTQVERGNFIAQEHCGELTNDAGKFKAVP
jgi:hypothetical protein